MTARLRQRLAEMVHEAADGELPVADLAGDESLTVLGLNSLGMLRLIDAIEIEYGIEVDLSADRNPLDTLDSIVAHLTERGVSPDQDRR